MELKTMSRSTKPGRKIYVLHPYCGQGRQGEREANHQRIGEICREIIRIGHVPISPIHALSFLDDRDQQDRATALKLCRPLIEVADEIWAFVIARRMFNPSTGGFEEQWVESQGCRHDHHHAEQLGKFITYHLCEPLGVCDPLRRDV